MTLILSPPFKADSPGPRFCHLTAVIVLIVPELRIAVSLAAAPSSSHAPPCVAQMGSPHTRTLGLTVSSPGVMFLGLYVPLPPSFSTGCDCPLTEGPVTWGLGFPD